MEGSSSGHMGLLLKETGWASSAGGIKVAQCALRAGAVCFWGEFIKSPNAPSFPYSPFLLLPLSQSFGHIYYVSTVCTINLFSKGK